ncbi:MAG: metal-sensitive transcriptional regulator [Candidatus Omnitrophota bacterium]
MKKGTPHDDQLVALRRIAGQVRGIQRMIETRRYCVDILNAIAAIRGALKTVEAKILKDHLNACAKQAFEGRSQAKKTEHLNEIYRLFESLRK